jgi:hypothetical protein
VVLAGHQRALPWNQGNDVTVRRRGYASLVEINRPVGEGLAGFRWLEDGKGDVTQAQRIAVNSFMGAFGYMERWWTGMRAIQAYRCLAAGTHTDGFGVMVVFLMRGIARRGDPQERTQEEQGQYAKPSSVVLSHFRWSYYER